MYDQDGMHQQCVEAVDRARQQIVEANAVYAHAQAGLSKARAGLERAEAQVRESQRRRLRGRMEQLPPALHLSCGHGSESSADGVGV